MGSATRHGLALVLAVLAATLFGLGAVRQHGAMQRAFTGEPHGRGLPALLRLVRSRGWLLGSAQATVASGLHVVALALAPIALVQPVGVLAVPVTVAAAARTERRWPSRHQVVGSLLSVLSIVGLTLLLLHAARAAERAVRLPTLTRVGATVVVLLMAAVLAGLLRNRLPRVVSAPVLACAAAVLFALTSVLLRVVGYTVVAGIAGPDAVLCIEALVGTALAGMLGVWLMHAAYGAGSPHAVVCCLTLVDPVAAVVGGSLLLHEDASLSGPSLTAAVVCAVLAAVGVVLLSDAPAVLPPDEEPDQRLEEPALTAPAAPGQRPAERRQAPT
jgi:hypothetical protein